MDRSDVGIDPSKNTRRASEAMMQWLVTDRSTDPPRAKADMHSKWCSPSSVSRIATIHNFPPFLLQNVLTAFCVVSGISRNIRTLRLCLGRTLVPVSSTCTARLLDLFSKVCHQQLTLPEVCNVTGMIICKCWKQKLHKSGCAIMPLLKTSTDIQGYASKLPSIGWKNNHQAFTMFWTFWLVLNPPAQTKNWPVLVLHAKLYSDV